MPSINLPTAVKQDEIKTSVDNINTRTTTMNTNLNTVNTNVNTLLAGRVVKSIQKGKVSLGVVSGTNSTSVTINSVNPNKCMVLLDGGPQSVTNFFIGAPYLDFLSSTSLGIRADAETTLSSAVNKTLSWQVIEYY